MRQGLKLLLVLAAVSSQVCAANTDEKITTDRPDYVESSDVVGAGRLQIETSYARERSTRDGSRESLSSTPTLLRIGISETLELRAESEGYLHSNLRSFPSGYEDSHGGYADISIGAKWHLLDATETAPSLGLLAHIDLDTGTRPFRAKGKGGSLRLTAEWELADDLALGLMPGVNWQVDELGQRYQSASLGLALGKEWSDQLRTFIEYAAPQIAAARHGGTQHTLDVGAAYLLSKNIQLDSVISRGLNRNTPDWNWSVGFSIKF